MFLISLLPSDLTSSQLLYNISTGLILIWLVNYLTPKIKRLFTLPPGPWGLPSVGYLPFLRGHDEYKDLDHLAKKYGPVYTFNLGKETIIVVNDWNHAKEVFKSELLLDRPKAFGSDSYGASIINMSGETWRAHRQNSLRLLRDLGLGKSSFEDKIIDEIQQFLPKLEKGPVENLLESILTTTTNTISFLLFGHGFEDDDPVKQDLIHILMTAIKIGTLFGIFKSGSPSIPISNETKLKMLTLPKHMQNEIDEHKKKQSKEFYDYIDGYLQEQKNQKDNDSSKNVTFDDATLRANIIGFYLAGSVTVAITLTWAILYLVKYPEYHEKIRSEIADVIGFERSPDYADRNQMPMTMSFIYEVHRIVSLVPVNLFRCATSDVKIGGFNVPKDSIVAVNFWTINHDPSLYTKPDEFNPNRFLTDRGTKAVKPQFLNPFSKGKRNCPGEGFASIELFLYLVSIVQKYKIECAPGSTVSLEARFSSLRFPKSIPSLVLTKISK